MSISDLINNISQGDVATSNNEFNSIMADKMNAALDLERQNVASTMYGSEEEPVAEVEPEMEMETEIEGE
jgi:hypothetical protein